MTRIRESFFTFLQRYGSWLFVLIAGPLLTLATYYFKLSNAPLTPILPYFVIILFLSPWEAGVGFLIAVSGTTYTQVTRPGESLSDIAVRAGLLLFLFLLIVYVKKRLIKNSEDREKLLRENTQTELFRELVDASPYAILVENEEGTILLANKEMQLLTGYEVSELAGSSVNIITPDRLREGRISIRNEAFRYAKDKRKRHYHNIAIKRSDGSEIYVDIYTAGVMWKNKLTLRVTIQDMTLINILEDERRSKEQELTSIVQNNPLLTILSNYEGVIVYCNTRVFDLFGYNPEELLGTRLEGLVPEHLRNKHEVGRLAYWEEQLERHKKGLPSTDKTLRSVDLYGLHKSGKVFRCDIALSWVMWEGKLTSLAIVRDLTAAEKLIHETTRANLAEQTLRMRDKFLSTAAHELKTPIASIVLYADLLENYFNNTLSTVKDFKKEFLSNKELTSKAIKAIQHQSLVVATLVNQFLDISLIRDAKGVTVLKEGVDMCATLKDIVEIAQLQTSNHTIKLYCPPGLMGYYDKLRVEQVMINLINNAIKYSPDGGEILITAGIDTSDYGISINVRDHGLGIPDDKRDKIFTRFFRAHEEIIPSGLGLGLYISKEIMLAHGGTIAFSDPKDEKGGTVFTIRFPPYRLPDKDE